MRQTGINISTPCRSLSLYLETFYLVEGNGMEEVVGSIPTRSTKSLETLPPQMHASASVMNATAVFYWYVSVKLSRYTLYESCL
jgi:hypothetical protein